MIVILEYDESEDCYEICKCRKFVNKFDSLEEASKKLRELVREYPSREFFLREIPD